MHKLLAITTALSVALAPMASAQTTGQTKQNQPQETQRKAQPPAANTATPKSDVSKPKTAKAVGKRMRHARHHRGTRMHGYRASGKRYYKQARLGYRSARHHHRGYRAMGYRAGCY